MAFRLEYRRKWLGCRDSSQGFPSFVALCEIDQNADHQKAQTAPEQPPVFLAFVFTVRKPCPSAEVSC